MNIPREDSVNSLVNSYLDLKFEFIHDDTNKGFADGNDIRIFDLVLIAFFSDYKLRTYLSIF